MGHKETDNICYANSFIHPSIAHSTMPFVGPKFSPHFGVSGNPLLLSSRALSPDKAAAT